MPEYRMRLEISHIGSDQPVEMIEETVSSDYEATQQGERNLRNKLAAEFRKAILYHGYFAEIPNSAIELVDSRPRKFDLMKKTSEWWDVLNTQALWLEISNSLADVRFLLGQARGYKSLEPSEDKTDDDSKQLRYYAHFAKMHYLNLAVFELVKIQDLVVRLLFENLGGPKLIHVDQTDADWEKKLTLAAAKSGLKNQFDSGSLQKQDYDEIVKALDCPSTSRHQATLVAYRNGVIHRLRPSVDYPQLFTPLEDRVGEPILDASGKVRGRKYTMWGLPDKPEFYFADLYTALLDYLKHIIEMLTLLKAIPRLA